MYLGCVGSDTLYPVPCLSTPHIPPPVPGPWERKTTHSRLFQIFCKKQMKQKITEFYLESLHACWYHTSLFLGVHRMCNGI